MRSCISFLLLLLVSTVDLQAQALHAKYGSEFLRVGGGARALSMGSSQAGLASGVSAAFWNPAGLRSVNQAEVMYMHTERFGGIVGYDYGAVAIPITNHEAVLSLSFFRQGVDNIANTLDAWDPNRGLNGGPKADVEQYITRFSATDMAWLISYASKKGFKNKPMYYGGTFKFVRQKLGPFARAWGYSLDVGVQGTYGDWKWGAQWIDATTLRKIWTVDEAQFQGFEEVFGDAQPSGTNEYVRPSLRLGIARTFHFKEWDLSSALDLVSLFEGREAYYLNIGSWSIEPRWGFEGLYRERLALRLGLTDLYDDPLSGWTVHPTMGLGIRLSQVQIDYGFMGFAGAGTELDLTHRVSVKAWWGKKP